MKDFKWKIIKDKTEDHWLELKGDDGSRKWKSNESEKGGTPIYPYSAVAKWDGCVIFTDFSSRYQADHEHNENCKVGGNCGLQSMHICDIDDMITMLQGIKEKAKEHFGKDWPED